MLSRSQSVATSTLRATTGAASLSTVRLPRKFETRSLPFANPRAFTKPPSNTSSSRRLPCRSYATCVEHAPCLEHAVDLGNILMENPEEEVEKLGEAQHDVVIPGPIETILVQIDNWMPPTNQEGTPLSFGFKVAPQDPAVGFTRGELAASIADMYKLLYDEEDAKFDAISAAEPKFSVVKEKNVVTMTLLTPPPRKRFDWRPALSEMRLQTGYWDSQANKLTLDIQITRKMVPSLEKVRVGW